MINSTKKLTLNEIQQVQLNILEQVDHFSKANKIQYFLTGGTLLGAIRHHGFIPWDDDIDIAMPRPHYERFIKLGINGIGNHCQISSFNRSSSHTRLYAKVIDDRYLCLEKYYIKRGPVFLGIDVFPVDGIPNKNGIASRKYLCEIRILRKAFILSQSILGQGSSITRKILKSGPILACKFIGGDFFYKKIHSLVKKYSYMDCDYAGILIGYYGKKEILPRHMYENLTVAEFEGNLYPVLSDFDQYLTNLYGNYHLPPISKAGRSRHHSFAVFPSFPSKTN